MHTSSLFTLATVLGTTLAKTSSSNATCATFEKTDQNVPDDLIPQRPRMSTGTHCDQNDHHCNVPGGGYVKLPRAIFFDDDNLNNNTVADNAAGLTIHQQTGASTNFTDKWGAVKNVSRHLVPGGDGYTIFLSSYNCIGGKLSDCPDNTNIEDGTYVSACYPVVTNETDPHGLPIWAGGPVIDISNEDDVRDKTDYPHQDLPPGVDKIVSAGATNGVSIGLVASIVVASIALIEL